MFKCEACKKTSQPREACNKVVTETRDKFNHMISAKNRMSVETFIVKDKEEIEKKIEELKESGYKILKLKDTKGSEIVKEVNLCRNCYENK